MTGAGHMGMPLCEYRYQEVPSHKAKWLREKPERAGHFESGNEADYGKEVSVFQVNAGIVNLRVVECFLQAPYDVLLC